VRMRSYAGLTSHFSKCSPRFKYATEWFEVWGQLRKLSHTVRAEEGRPARLEALHPDKASRRGCASPQPERYEINSLASRNPNSPPHSSQKHNDQRQFQHLLRR